MFKNGSPQSDKGDYGEKLVTDYLESRGCTIIEHSSHESAHVIDLLVRGKDFFTFYVEVKTKQRRNSYPDISVPAKQYVGYKRLQKERPVWLFFVDESVGWIYGQELSVLDKECGCYPLEMGGFRYYPLSKMIKFESLTIDEIEKLKELDFANGNKFVV